MDNRGGGISALPVGVGTGDVVRKGDGMAVAKGASVWFVDRNLAERVGWYERTVDRGRRAGLAVLRRHDGGPVFVAWDKIRGVVRRDG